MFFRSGMFYSLLPHGVSQSAPTSNIKLQTSNIIHVLPEVILFYSKVVAKLFDGHQLAGVFAVQHANLLKDVAGSAWAAAGDPGYISWVHKQAGIVF